MNKLPAGSSAEEERDRWYDAFRTIVECARAIQPVDLKASIIGCKPMQPRMDRCTRLLYLDCIEELARKMDLVMMKQSGEEI